MPTTFYIVRHGQSLENIEFALKRNRSKGAIGYDLTPQGERQVSQLVRKLAPVHLDAVFTSHLLRAHHTAQIIAKNKGLNVCVEINLQERIVNLNKETKRNIWNDPTILYGDSNTLTQEQIWKWKPYKNAESEEEVVTRFISSLRAITASYIGKTVLIVTHGQIMRSFLVYLRYSTFKNLPFIREGSIINTAYIRVETDGIDFALKETWGITKNT